MQIFYFNSKVFGWSIYLAKLYFPFSLIAKISCWRKMWCASSSQISLPKIALPFFPSASVTINASFISVSDIISDVTVSFIKKSFRLVSLEKSCSIGVSNIRLMASMW